MTTHRWTASQENKLTRRRWVRTVLCGALGLLAHHAVPLWARPMRVDVSRMSKKQREMLEAARDVKSLESKK